MEKEWEKNCNNHNHNDDDDDERLSDQNPTDSEIIYYYF